jgi:hypothetical protein
LTTFEAGYTAHTSNKAFAVAKGGVGGSPPHSAGFTILNARQEHLDMNELK